MIKKKNNKIVTLPQDSLTFLFSIIRSAYHLNKIFPWNVLKKWNCTIPLTGNGSEGAVPFDPIKVSRYPSSRKCCRRDPGVLLLTNGTEIFENCGWIGKRVIPRKVSFSRKNFNHLNSHRFSVLPDSRLFRTVQPSPHESGKLTVIKNYSHCIHN